MKTQLRISIGSNQCELETQIFYQTQLNRLGFIFLCIQSPQIPQGPWMTTRTVIDVMKRCDGL